MVVYYACLLFAVVCVLILCVLYDLLPQSDYYYDEDEDGYRQAYPKSKSAIVFPYKQCIPHKLVAELVVESRPCTSFDSHAVADEEP